MLTIHAATVILLRDGSDGPEILMVERGEQLAFAGGALVLLATVLVTGFNPWRGSGTHAKP